MEKKLFKPIVLSALSAMAFGAVGAAGTFALFTDKAETTVNVEAGKVDISTEIAILSASELGDVAMVKDSETLYHNSIGGGISYNASTGVLSLTKWAPGDKAVIKITNKTLSNVAIKTRLLEQHTSTSQKDLYDVLKLTYAVTDHHQDVDSVFRWRTVPAAQQENGDLLSEVTLTIEFPNHGQEITVREEGYDNGFQGMSCELKITQQAVQGNAGYVSLPDQLDEILAGSVADNKTMSDAMTEVSGLANEARIAAENIVWDSVTDRFLYSGETSGAKERYFHIYDEMPVTETWSIYASEAWNQADVVTSVGFDEGANDDISTLRILTEEASNLTFKTNGGTFIVDAPLATINHYGSATRVNIRSVAGNSYHEHGSVDLVSVKKGHVAIESGSNLIALHLEKTEENNEVIFDELKLSVKDGVSLPMITRDSVGTALEEPLKVVEVAKTEGQTTTTEFIYLTGNGTIEDEKVLVAAEDNAAAAVAVTDVTASDAAKAVANAKEAGEAVDTGKTVAEVVESFEGKDVYSSVTRKFYTKAELGTDGLEDVLKLGGTVTLYSDFEDNTMSSTGKGGALVVKNNVVIEGNGHTLTSSATRFVRLLGDNSGDPEEITIRNLTIYGPERAIETRGEGLGKLTLENVNLLTAATGSSRQPFTVGGNQAAVLDLTIKDSYIGTDATHSYAITTFNPVDLKMYGSEIKGWACFNIKAPSSSAGSSGSTFKVVSSTFRSKNVYSGVSNAYAAVKIEDVQIALAFEYVDFYIGATGDQMQSIISMENYAVNGVTAGFVGCNGYFSGFENVEGWDMNKYWIVNANANNFTLLNDDINLVYMD